MGVVCVLFCICVPCVYYCSHPPTLSPQKNTNHFPTLLRNPVDEAPSPPAEPALLAAISEVLPGHPREAVSVTSMLLGLGTTYALELIRDPALLRFHVKVAFAIVVGADVSMVTNM